MIKDSGCSIWTNNLQHITNADRTYFWGSVLTNIAKNQKILLLSRFEIKFSAFN